MKIIVCLDDNSGMLFNNRRQSRDRVVCEDIVKNLEGEKLYISPFSQILFENFRDDVCVSEDFLLNGNICFVENQAVSQCDADEVIVYKWNRVYPSDFYCDIDFSKYFLTEQTELEGFSHEKITKEVYKRVV
ncbi:MAG: hypothetical protein J6D06_04010 [Clostridia bacterium]|nr:hypothetical protein [Clostridia bacterium]